MKRLIFAGSLLLASGTASLADGMFWVVGNRATGKCNIVTSQTMSKSLVNRSRELANLGCPRARQWFFRLEGAGV